ncbi:hypothetical protein GQ54DRAFT_97501 [Martensiomyces pterosporus]|nr:hypothetical protein GQ54DRAFT_97501 [Martensiomyces pterosporus]
MGFKRPKTKKSFTNPLEDDKVERDLDPAKVLSGGGKAAKKGNRNTSDAPKAFQNIMRFMEMKQKNDQAKRQQKAKDEKRKAKAAKAVKAEDRNKPKQITERLKIMPGESMQEFDRRVQAKMNNNLRLVGTINEPQAKASTNPSKDEGDEAMVSKRTDRKRRNDAVRKERKLAKKHRSEGSDEEEVREQQRQTSTAPKFGEQADAPPIFKALPKEKFKKMVPLPQSKEEELETKNKEDLAVKNMIKRTARLSPLERMQVKRKAKKEGDTAAEKRILAVERENAIRRYRMLKVARESKSHA